MPLKGEEYVNFFLELCGSSDKAGNALSPLPTQHAFFGSRALVSFLLGGSQKKCSEKRLKLKLPWFLFSDLERRKTLIITLSPCPHAPPTLAPIVRISHPLWNYCAVTDIAESEVTKKKERRNKQSSFLYCRPFTEKKSFSKKSKSTHQK